jgi:hypothetical protein
MQRAQVQLADPPTGEGLHRPGPLERRGADDGVEHGQRRHAVGGAGGDVEAHGTADVVHDEVEAIELQRVERGERPGSQARPAIVEPLRALREPQAREVEGDAAQAACRQLGEDLAVQERRGGHAVQAHDRRAGALLPDHRRGVRDGERAPAGCPTIDDRCDVGTGRHLRHLPPHASR